MIQLLPRQVFATCALLTACAAPDSVGPGIACQVTKQAELPIELSNGVILVPARINQAPVTLLFDTGAETTAVTGETASRLGLVADPANGTLMSGIGGQGLPQSDVLVDDLAFGPFASGATHYAVIDLPVAPHEPPVSGLLGDDVLARFDLDLDLPARRLDLYEVHHCAGNFLPWPAGYATVPLRADWDDPRLRLTVQLDGQPLTALLDTGATLSVLGRDAAERLGLSGAALETASRHTAVGAAGVNAGETDHSFRDFLVGPEHLTDVSLGVLDRTLHDEDMLLGLDYLASRHVWISFRTRQLFIAPAAAVAAGN